MSHVVKDMIERQEVSGSMTIIRRVTDNVFSIPEDK